MKNPYIALLWEIGRQYRWGFVLVAACLAFSAGLTRIAVDAREKFNAGEAAMVPGIDDAQQVERIQKQAELESRAQVTRELAVGTGVCTFGPVMLVLLVIFAGAEPNRLRGFSGVPTRRFVLPVSTMQLIFWPVTLGSALMFGAWCAWWYWVFAPLHYSDDIWVTALAWLFPAALVWFEAIVWGLVSFPKLRVAALLMLMLGLIVMLTIALEPGRLIDSHPEATHAIPLMLAGALVAGVVAAWFGVRVDRRGGWPEAVWIRKLRGRLARLSAPRGSFRSAFRAQVWLEWRRNLRVPLWVWAGCLAMLVFFQTCLFVQGAESVGLVEITMAMLGFGILAWFAIVGLNLARDGAGTGLSVSTFVGTRPLGIQTLVVAKLTAGALAWLAMWLMTATVEIGWAMTIGRGNDLLRLLENNRGVWSWLALVFFSLHLMVGILPLCLTGRIPGFPWSMAPLLVAYSVGFHALRGFDYFRDTQMVTAILLVALVVSKLIAATAGFVWCLARRLVGWRYAAGCAGFWIVGVSLGVVAALWLRIVGVDSEFQFIAIPAAFAVVPIARLAWAPLAMAKNRAR